MYTKKSNIKKLIKFQQHLVLIFKVHETKVIIHDLKVLSPPLKRVLEPWKRSNAQNPSSENEK